MVVCAAHIHDKMIPVSLCMKDKLQGNIKCRKDFQTFRYHAEPFKETFMFYLLFTVCVKTFPITDVCFLQMWTTEGSLCCACEDCRHILKKRMFLNVSPSLQLQTTSCTLLLTHWDRVTRIQLHISFPKLTLPLRHMIRSHFARITLW